MRLVFAGFIRKFESNIHQKNDYQSQGGRYLNISTDVPKTHFSICFSKRTVKSRNIVPNTMLSVKAINSFGTCGKSTFAPINPPANQAAEILTERPESALSQGLVNMVSTGGNVAGSQGCVNQILGRSKGAVG